MNVTLFPSKFHTRTCHYRDTPNLVLELLEDERNLVTAYMSEEVLDRLINQLEAHRQFSRDPRSDTEMEEIYG